MLVISKDQMTVLSDYMLGNFLKVAVIHLRKRFPDETGSFSDEDLFRFIRKAIAKAATYKIIERRDVMKYMEYMIRFGNDFDTDPPVPLVRKILRTKSFSGPEKIERIEKLDLNKVHQ